MSDLPKIDIIIPAYEAHDFLAIGLHSIACQTFAKKRGPTSLP